MFDRGFFITLQAIRRQLAAMPHELYLIRLIHHTTREPFPGERLWTAPQLGYAPAVRFLRMRNLEGCDIYIQPYANQDRNAGYILVDLDRTNPAVIENMRANGHDPCVVLQTSPGHLQAWIHLSTSALEPAVATAAGKQLARLYGGDLGSTDWRHLGRLAGFTNQKPERRTPGGYAPWVKIVHAHPGLARSADGLLQSAIQLPAPAWLPTQGTVRQAERLRRETAKYRPAIDRRRRGHPDLSRLDAAMADCRTLPAAGLEHRGFLDRQAVAVAGYIRRPGPSHSPTRQPTLSPPPR